LDNFRTKVATIELVSLQGSYNNWNTNWNKAFIIKIYDNTETFNVVFNYL